MKYTFTVTGSIEADNEDVAQGKLEHALSSIDSEVDVDLTEEEPEPEDEETETA